MLSAVCSLVLADSAAAAPAPRPWTVAVYVNADNDLAYTWPRFTLPSLRRIPASAGLNVVALVDTPGKHGVKLQLISGRTVRTVAAFRERDMGYGATFSWFLRQVSRRFPSDHLAVVGWDHGYGWHYFSYDDTSGDQISLPELRRAITAARVPIDILAFDACNMSDVDVAYGLATTGLVKLLVASEETIDQDGFPYDAMFTPLAETGAAEPASQVALDIVTGWERYYRSLRCFDWVNLTATDLSAIPAVIPAMTEWARLLRANISSCAGRYRADLDASTYAYDSWQLDLAQFCDRLAADEQIGDAALRAASQRLVAAIRSAVVRTTHVSYSPGFSGLALWLGTGREWREYRTAYRHQSSLGAVTGWYRFLRLWNATSSARPKPLNPAGVARYGLTDVLFTDQANGWATGYDNLTSTAIILHTRDGGSTWTTLSRKAWYAYMLSSLAPLPGGLLAAGSEGADGSLIWRSAKGSAWTLRPSYTAEYLLGVDSVGARTAWIAGTRHTLLRSDDGGRTWRSCPAPGPDLLGLDFTGRGTGWVLAADPAHVIGSIRHTTDGGRSWTQQATVPGSLLYAIDDVGGSQAWSVGGDPAGGHGVILHTADGTGWSVQWQPAGQARLSDIDMIDTTSGWAVGDGGVILHTGDGGSTWTPQASGVTFDLAAVCAVDARNVWAVGDGDAMLHTLDGGLTWTAAPAKGAPGTLPRAPVAPAPMRTRPPVPVH